MEYCPKDTPINIVWINHGISECFMNTVSSAVIGGFLLIFGTLQLFMYHKYAIEIERTQIGKSKLYVFQLLLLIVVPILAVIRFILEGFIFDGHVLYGYMVSNKRTNIKYQILIF